LYIGLVWLYVSYQLGFRASKRLYLKFAGLEAGLNGLALQDRFKVINAKYSVGNTKLKRYLGPLSAIFFTADKKT
jgi:hypothetical protein